MTKTAPTVRDHMSASPHTLGDEQSLAKANELMHEYHIRHVPVLRGGKLLGVLSDRDLKLIESFPNIDLNKVTVSEAMTPDPYAVTADTPLSQVAREMAQHKYGCAIVMDNNKVAGVLTTVDMCKALADILESR